MDASEMMKERKKKGGGEAREGGREKEREGGRERGRGRRERERERKSKICYGSRTKESASVVGVTFGGLVNCPIRSLAGRSLVRSPASRRQSLLTLGFSTLPDHDLAKRRTK